MNMTDPIADLLTRIRNANKERLDTVIAPYSKLKEQILDIFQKGGYIRRFEVVGEGIRKSLVITLKYSRRKESVIVEIKRISKPGSRVYVGYKDFKHTGGGIDIFSTPKGLLTDDEARKEKIGGEWICRIV